MNVLLTLLNVIAMLTSPCTEHPGKPHFIRRKVGFTGNVVFLFQLKTMNCGYSLEPSLRGRDEREHHRLYTENDIPRAVKSSTILQRIVSLIMGYHHSDVISNTQVSVQILLRA